MEVADSRSDDLGGLAGNSQQEVGDRAPCVITIESKLRRTGAGYPLIVFASEFATEPHVVAAVRVVDGVIDLIILIRISVGSDRATEEAVSDHAYARNRPVNRIRRNVFQTQHLREVGCSAFRRDDEFGRIRPDSLVPTSMERVHDFGTDNASPSRYEIAALQRSVLAASARERRLEIWLVDPDKAIEHGILARDIVIEPHRPLIPGAADRRISQAVETQGQPIERVRPG